jgi:hypothetical protein
LEDFEGREEARFRMRKAIVRHGTTMDTSKRSNFTPEGWHTVTPRIVVHGAQQLAEFVRHVFGATGGISGIDPRC